MEWKMMMILVGSGFYLELLEPMEIPPVTVNNRSKPLFVDAIEPFELIENL